MSLALCVPSWVWVDLRPPEALVPGSGFWGWEPGGKVQVLPCTWSSPSLRPPVLPLGNSAGQWCRTGMSPPLRTGRPLY